MTEKHTHSLDEDVPDIDSSLVSLTGDRVPPLISQTKKSVGDTLGQSGQRPAWDTYRGKRAFE